MATKTEKHKVSDLIEDALDAFEAATPEERLDTGRGSVSDTVHAGVREGLRLVGHDPHDVQTLYTRGFISPDDPTSWSKAVRNLIAELRA